MDFEFYTAGRIIRKRGGIGDLPKILENRGKKALVVIGGASIKKSGILKRVADGFKSCGIAFHIHDGIDREPEPGMVDETVKAGIAFGADMVVGIGGGSVLDTAKAAAGIITSGGHVVDYLEGVGSGRKLTEAPLYYAAVPTTSGTGTEVTKNAVIMSPEKRYKKSMRDERLIPDVVLLDPELTVSVPKDVTAASGADAVCQLIESFTAKRANEFCDAMVLYHTPVAVKALRACYLHPDDIGAREAMQLAATVSGMCLANAGLGAAHGIGAGMGAVCGIKHGIACGVLLPHVMRYNIAHGVTKYTALGEAFTGRKWEKTEDALKAAVDTIAELNGFLKLPVRLRELGIKETDVPALAKASMGSSMRKNPVDISVGECADFIRSIL